MEVSEVRFKEVLEGAETLRFDSDYYLKYYLKIENLIKTNLLYFSKLQDIESLQPDGSAFYPALEPYYEKGNFPFLRVGDIKDNFVDYEGCIKVPFEISPNFPTLKQVNIGDIVLTKGGTIANAGLITQNAFVSRDLIFINSSSLKEEDYIALFLYFKTNFAYQQLIRSSSQSVQPHLTITLVRNIFVKQFSNHFKKQITHIYKIAVQKLEESKTLYTAAEQLLLKELGLEGATDIPLLKEVEYLSNHNIKSFKDSFLAMSRLDAEYYQRKYEELKKLCFENANYTKKIKDIQTHNARGLQPEYVENGELDVINSRHILETGIDKNLEKTSLNYWDLQIRARVFKNDILIYTTGANIGRTQVYLSDEKALASNHVNILRIKDENPIYVAFVLNSKIGRLQTEQLSAGSAQQELYPKDIENFYVPFVNIEIQTEISTKIQESFLLRAESDRLLALAKEMVEVAIEKGEAEALSIDL